MDALEELALKKEAWQKFGRIDVVIKDDCLESTRQYYQTHNHVKPLDVELQEFRRTYWRR